MPEVDLRTFAAARAAGATVLDVREPMEYATGHVPGARSVPARRLPGMLVELMRAAPVYLLCASGVRSGSAAEALVRAGIEAYSVAGGTNAWAAQGRPIARGRRDAG